MKVDSHEWKTTSWMRRPCLVLVVGCSLWSALAQTCNFTDNFMPLSTARSCFDAVPPRSSWITGTVDGLAAVLQQYSFRDLYRASGMPWNYQSDMIGELEALRERTFQSDWEFQEAVQSIIRGLHDAHTVYSKPDCYGVVAMLPIWLTPVYNSMGEISYFLGGLQFGGKNVMDVVSPELKDYIGYEVETIDGVPLTTAIAEWAAAYEFFSNDVGVRFTAALERRTFWVRDLSTFPLPARNNVSLGLRVFDANDPENADPSSLVTVTVPWVIAADSSVENVSDFEDRCRRTSYPSPPPNCSRRQRRLSGKGGVSPLASVDRLRWAAEDPLEQRWRARRDKLRSRRRGRRARRAEDEGVEREEGSLATQVWEAVYTGRTDLLGPQAQGLEEGAEWTVVSDTRNENGLLVVYYRPPEGAKDLVTGAPLNSAVVLKISTFNPATVSSCFDVSIPACPTPEEEEQVARTINNCYFSKASSFVSQSAAKVHEVLNSDPGAYVILDFTRNGGGNILLGQLFMLYLMKDLYEDPLKILGPMEMHRSPLLAHMSEWVEQADIAQEDFSDFPLFGWYNEDATEGMPADNFQWYREGPYRQYGGAPYRESSTLRLFNTSAYVGSLAASKPSRRLNSSQVVILTDGLCGSMCAQTLRTLQGNLLARVIGIRVHPRLPSDSSSFAGGIVLSDMDSIVGVYLQAENLGYPGPPSTSATTAAGGRIYPLDYLPTTAGMSYNWAHILSGYRRPQWPLQFDPRLPDGRAVFWPSSLPATAAYETIVQIIPGVTLPAASDRLLSGRGDGKNDKFLPEDNGINTPEEYTIVGLVAVGGFALGVVVVVVWSIISDRRAQAQQQQRAIQRDGRPRPSGQQEGVQMVDWPPPPMGRTNPTLASHQQQREQPEPVVQGPPATAAPMTLDPVQPWSARTTETDAAGRATSQPAPEETNGPHNV